MKTSLHIPMALRSAYLSMHRQTNAHLSSLGVTADQFVCLTALSKNEGIIQSELVGLTHSDPNTISAIVAKLEKKQLIYRESHPDDRRARVVRLTEAGKLAVSHSVNSLKPVHEQMDAAISESDAKTLISLLNRLCESLQ